MKKRPLQILILLSGVLLVTVSLVRVEMMQVHQETSIDKQLNTQEKSLQQKQIKFPSIFDAFT